MKEHALPQDVTGYRFHIIGNMTLKQFAEVAIGCVVGFLIYSTNLPSIIKYPLILISAGIGGAMAFVPFEERPLDQWLLAAIRVLYRPTQFYWQRTTKVPEPFLYEPSDKTKSIVQEVDLTPARRQRVKEYLNSIDTSQTQDEVEQYTQARVGEVMSIFADGLNLAAPSQTAGLSASLAASPTSLQAPQPVVVPDEIPNLLAAAQLENLPTVTTAPKVVESNYQLATLPPALETVGTPTTPAPTASTPQAAVVVPTQAPVSVQTTVQLESSNSTPLMPATDERAFSDNQFLPPTPQVDQTEFAAPLSPAIPLPLTPSEPNKIVGVVTTANHQTVDNAIVEILTPDGFPARAVKTNMLGQFFITTPLGNGSYVIRAEKEGLEFATQQLQLSGSLVEPVVVTSR
jgi:hypothetical protein